MAVRRTRASVTLTTGSSNDVHEGPASDDRQRTEVGDCYGCLLPCFDVGPADSLGLESFAFDEGGVSAPDGK